jgi:C-terminal processing protease CtpA/Prc
VDYIAARFASTREDYVRVRTKNGPGRYDFSSPVYFTINPAGTRYTKPVVLLTNKQTISGGEWFTLSLLSQDHVTHTGSATNGAFSLGLERRLANGWLYWVSVQIVEDMNGVCHEGTGIIPEYIVTNITGELESGRDRQLEFARNLFLD